jgi:hypothetical protein
LDGRAWNRSVRAKDTTVAGLRFKPETATFAVIEELAGVGWHRLGGLVATSGTGQGGLSFHSRPVGQMGQKQNQGTSEIQLRAYSVLTVSEPKL